MDTYSYTNFEGRLYFDRGRLIIELVCVSHGGVLKEFGGICNMYRLYIICSLYHNVNILCNYIWCSIVTHNVILIAVNHQVSCKTRVLLFTRGHFIATHKAFDIVCSAFHSSHHRMFTDILEIFWQLHSKIRYVIFIYYM